MITGRRPAQSRRSPGAWQPLATAMTTTTLLVLPIAIAPTPAAVQQAVGTAAVLTTSHFALFSDLATNVNDALIAAANARRAQRPDSMADGESKACFDGLSPDDRRGW